MSIKASRYELLQLCIGVHEKTMVVKTAGELLNSNDKFSKSLGYNMRILSCETYADLVESFEQYRDEKE